MKKAPTGFLSAITSVALALALAATAQTLAFASEAALAEPAVTGADSPDLSTAFAIAMVAVAIATAITALITALVLHRRHKKNHRA